MFHSNFTTHVFDMVMSQYSQTNTTFRSTTRTRVTRMISYMYSICVACHCKCQRAVTSAHGSTLPCSTCVQAKSNATNVLSSSRRAWRRSRTANLQNIHGNNQATPNTNTRGHHTPPPQHTATMSIAPQRGAPPKRSSTVLVRHSHLPLHFTTSPINPRFRSRLVSRGLRNPRAVHG
jgi:hypothetical protein